jgi:hypothetical protein
LGGNLEISFTGIKGIKGIDQKTLSLLINTNLPLGFSPPPGSGGGRGVVEIEKAFTTPQPLLT